MVCVCVLQMKSEIAYANSKGIEVGGYDLIVLTRGVPEYWRDIGGDGACIASSWCVCARACVWSYCTFVSEMCGCRHFGICVHPCL